MSNEQRFTPAFEKALHDCVTVVHHVHDFAEELRSGEASMESERLATLLAEGHRAWKRLVEESPSVKVWRDGV